MRKILEYTQQDLDVVKSFKVRDTLAPIWDNNKLLPQIKEKLLNIANSFYKTLNINVPYEDVILLGSLANYNWNEKYSDFDLHILIDFSKVNEDVELVRNYFNAAKVNWNKEHDIKISGFEVEVYCQDIDEKNSSGGVYSVLNDIWIKTPVRNEQFIDEVLIETKLKKYMDIIDDLSHRLKFKADDEILEEINTVWKKIKQGRQIGLSEFGENAVENLVFKALRRNGYIGKIIDLIKKWYSLQFNI